MAETVMNILKVLRKPAVAVLVVGLLLMYRQNSALAASGGRMGGSSFSSRSSRSSSSSRSSRSYSTSGSRDYGTSPLTKEEICVELIVAVIILAICVYALVETATVKTSVLKLQVGLLGSAKSLQKDLNLIAETADTSASKGLHYVLTETVVALLRHPDYCISGYSSVDVKRSMEAGEQIFNQLSVEERGKLDEETLVNVNNIKKKSSTILKPDGFNNEYIVVTILVAAEGEHKMPSINSSKDLKEALQMLASIPSTKTLVVVKKSMDAGEKKFNRLSVEERGKLDEETLVNVNNFKKKSSTILKADGFNSEYIVVTILVAAEGKHKLPSINSSKELKEALQKLASIPSTRTLAVEVLWTPQKEDDTLSERELREDYPLLRPLQ